MAEKENIEEGLTGDKIEEGLIVEDTKKLKIWRIIAVVLLIIVITLATLYALGIGWKEEKQEEPKEEEKPPTESILTLWKEDSKSKQELVSYIKKVTDKNGGKYIPPEDRIAVFDFDGTIFCETDTLYFDYLMFSYRVLNDTDYKGKATQEEIDAANIVISADIHHIPPNLQMAEANAYPHAFENMTYKQLEDYTKNYMKLDSVTFEGMKRGEEFFEPMVELIQYLQANDFQVYICSGGDRHIYRTVARSRLNIPEDHIKGTIASVAATGQKNRSDSTYEYKNDDELIVGGDFIYKNVRMNKVSLIKTEIGKQPVLSFGNSAGDYSMAAYVTSGKKYESRAFMICCDDLVRENGNEEEANKMKTKCGNTPNWVAVSMRDDWIRIFAEGVRKKGT